MVAPAYPSLALSEGIEAEIAVIVDVDKHGRVTDAMAVNGPCRYSSPPAVQGGPACDFEHDAAAHRELAEKLFRESLDESLPQPERREKFKEFDTEHWLAAQDEVYAAAEKAARQWQFESLRPATPPGHHVLSLTFRFSIAGSASIRVVDPWSIAVVATRYPGISD